MTLRTSTFALVVGLPFLTAIGQTPHIQSTAPAASAATAVPALVPYSGTAIAGDTKPLSGEVAMTFLIYKDEEGGEPLWTESQTASVDATGHYKIQLGAASLNGLPSDLFATGEARWLEVQIAGEKPQARVLLASVPYALKAADATTLGGLPVSAFALAGSKPATISFAVPGAASPDANATVTTPGGKTGYLPVFTGSTTIGDSILYASSTGVGVGDVPNSTAVFDVNGKSIWRGLLNVARAGTATTSTGYASYPALFQASSYNSKTKAATLPQFQLQAEPSGNNTAGPGATFNLLYNSNGGTPSETGLFFNNNGTIHFASGQTFPGTGAGTITGVTAGTGLTGGGTSGKVTLNVNTGEIPTLGGNNTFTGSDFFTASLYEDTDVNIDNTNANSGNISPGLRFGQASGEGMASKRTSGGNQYGLDFYTDYADRMSISEAGYVGIGTAPAEGTMLYVNGGAYAGEFDNNSSEFPALFAGNDYSGGTSEVFETYGQGGVCLIDTNSNLTCEGNINGNDLARRIDDPQDPANKYLVHSSVQSSEMMNIYSGNVITDENGTATVVLPSWFEAENGDFRYQLTMIGRDAHAWVSQEVANGQFKIATNATNVKVSWQITAVRQDGYAKAHPLVAEQAKPSGERGFYQHPEYFGQPKEKGFAWAHDPKRMKENQYQKDRSKAHTSVSIPVASAPAITPRMQDAQLRPNGQ
jgi:hypothetical protein